MTALETVLALTSGLLLLAWARSARVGLTYREQRDDARKERNRAQDDRDDYATKLLTAREQLARAVTDLAQADTQHLPAWPEFLPAQPGLPADQVTATLDALERHANGEGR